MQQITPREAYREVREEAGKDAVKVLFILFVCLPLALFAFFTLADYMGGFYAAIVIFIFFLAVVAYRKHGLK